MKDWVWYFGLFIFTDLGSGVKLKHDKELNISKIMAQALPNAVHQIKVGPGYYNAGHQQFSNTHGFFKLTIADKSKTSSGMKRPQFGLLRREGATRTTWPFKKHFTVLAQILT